MEMKKRNRKELDVGFVCTGNHCRSPIAEAIAKKIAKVLEVEEKIEIISRGTEVEKIFTKDFPTGIFLPYIEKALTSGFLTEWKEPILIEIARKALKTKGADQIAMRTIIARMLEAEDCYRNIAIAEAVDPQMTAGLATNPHIPRQLTRSDNLDIVLAMGESNKKSAIQIFSGAVRIPRVLTLGEFTGNPTIIIPDPMGGKLQEYRDAVEEFKPIVARSIHGLILYIMEKGIEDLTLSVRKQFDEEM